MIWDYKPLVSSKLVLHVQLESVERRADNFLLFSKSHLRVSFPLMGLIGWLRRQRRTKHCLWKTSFCFGFISNTYTHRAAAKLITGWAIFCYRVLVFLRHVGPEYWGHSAKVSVRRVNCGASIQSVEPPGESCVVTMVSIAEHKHYTPCWKSFSDFKPWVNTDIWYTVCCVVFLVVSD